MRDLPIIPDSMVWLWRAYQELSGKRLRFDGNPQPIPVSEILAYAVFHHIDEECRRDLLYIIVSRLDSTALQHHYDKKPTPPPPPRR